MQNNSFAPLYWLCLSGIHSQSIFSFESSLRNYYLFREFPNNPLSFSRIHFKSTFSFANSIMIYYYFARSLWIDYVFRGFTLNPLSFLRVHYWFFIFFENSLCNDYLFRKFTLKPLTLPRISYQSNFFREFTLNPLSLFLRIHFEFTISFGNFLSIMFFVNSLAIYFPFRQSAMNTRSLSRINSQFIIFFTNSL